MSLPPGSAVAVPVLAVAVAFAALCLVDLARAGQVRYLPKWVWAVVICVSVPWGGLAYLIFGKGRPAASMPWKAPVAEEAGIAASGPLLAGRVPVSPVVIEVDQLTKRFGPVTAVDGLSFTVRPGHVTGFLGPNGAGKTTTMRVILGLEAPTSGRRWSGAAATRRSSARCTWPARCWTRPLCMAAGPPGFTCCPSRKATGSGGAGSMQVLEAAGLAAVAGLRVREFSLGMKQRLGIAAALLADPAVLIFDEPVNGLDAAGVRWIRQLLSRWPPRAAPSWSPAI